MKASSRVLLVQDFLHGIGGTESYVLSLKKYLEENGNVVRLFGSTGGENLSTYFSRWYSFKYYRRFYQELQSFKPTVVHVHHLYRNLSPSILLAAKKLNIPVIQTVHGYNYICPKVWMVNDVGKIITNHESTLECILHHLPKKNILYSLPKQLKVAIHRPLISKNVDRFICPSKDLYEFYEKRYPGRVSFIPNFVEESPQGLPKNHNASLLYVGRLSYEKGLDVLLNAFIIIVRKYPDTKLVIVGDGPENASLHTICQNLGLTNNVRFVGFIPTNKISPYYKDALAVILPSICVENCPISALEAVAAHRPIIASNAGGLKDIVRDGENGFLFQRADVEDLSNKILELLANPRLVKNFSINQKTKMYQYEPSLHIKRIIGEYDRVAK